MLLSSHILFLWHWKGVLSTVYAGTRKSMLRIQTENVRYTYGLILEAKKLSTNFLNGKLVLNFWLQKLDPTTMEVVKFKTLTDDGGVIWLNVNHVICGGDARVGETVKRFRWSSKHCDLIWKFRYSFGLLFEIKHQTLILKWQINAEFLAPEIRLYDYPRFF